MWMMERALKADSIRATMTCRVSRLASSNVSFTFCKHISAAFTLFSVVFFLLHMPFTHRIISVLLILRHLFPKVLSPLNERNRSSVKFYLNSENERKQIVLWWNQFFRHAKYILSNPQGRYVQNRIIEIEKSIGI